MIVAFDGHRPEVSEDAFIAPDAVLVGRVRVEAGASVWYGAVLRADGDAITVASGANIQDGTVIHADPGFPAVVEEDATVGHRSVLHGCRVGRGALVGMGSVLLNGSRLGAGALLGAAALLPEGREIPDGMLALGSPARQVRPLTPEEARELQRSARHYRSLADAYR